jgi:NAD(P)-dependent dehydrogenase (short-subunit alcohol dehydrogenase family)
MIPNKKGAIVNIGSYASSFAFPTIAAYCASKGALAQLTRTLALELAEHGSSPSSARATSRDATRFSREAALGYIAEVRPGLPVLEVSAKTGAGMDTWLETLVRNRSPR